MRHKNTSQKKITWRIILFTIQYSIMPQGNHYCLKNRVKAIQTWRLRAESTLLTLLRTNACTSSGNNLHQMMHEVDHFCQLYVKSSFLWKRFKNSFFLKQEECGWTGQQMQNRIPETWNSTEISDYEKWFRKLSNWQLLSEDVSLIIITTTNRADVRSVNA